MNRKFILVIGIVLLTVSMLYESGVLNVLSNAQPGVSVSVDPGSLNVAPNDVFNLSIRIAGAQDVARWTLSLQWDASVLELFPDSSQAFVEGPFMSKFGITTFHRPLSQGSGVVSSISCDFRPPRRANGDGILFNVTFRAIIDGKTNITIYDCYLTSSSTIRTTPTLNNVSVLVGTGVKSETHALSVSLDCPAQAYVNQGVLLNTTITNQGTLYETYVNLTMTINGAYETNTFPLTVPMPIKGANSTTNKPWSFSHAGIYGINVTIDEKMDDSSNGSATATVVVLQPKKAGILIVSDDGGYYQQYGTSLNEFKTALDAAGYSYDVYVESVSGPILNASTLTPYTLVIWTCGDFAQWVIDPREELALVSYFKAGGNVLLEGEKVVSDLVSRNQHLLMDEVLHVKWDKFAVTTLGIEPVYTHPLTQGLTSASWTRAPTYYPDGVETIQGGFAVMNYVATNFSAITVVDGSETGTGSAIYLSFSVSTLSEAYRTLLIRNAVQWFNRFGVSVVLGEVIRAPPQSVSFIYGGLPGSNGSGFDTVAGSMLYSLCENDQVQGFADSQNVSKPNGTLIVAFGSPFDNGIIKRMNASGILPIIVYQDSGDANHYQFRNSTSNALVYDFEIGSGNSSLFIIQAFTKDDTTYLVVCGLDWQGMWASGMKLSRVICQNLRDYGRSCCIFEWKNSNENSIPRTDDYQMQQTLSTVR